MCCISDAHLIGVWLKKMIGYWTWTFGKLVLRFNIGAGGLVTIGTYKTHLKISTDAKLKGSDRWFTFKYGAYWYYIRLLKGMWMHAFGNSCKKAYLGISHYCGFAKVIKGKQQPNFNLIWDHR